MSDDPSKTVPSCSNNNQRSAPITPTVNGGPSRRTGFSVNLAVAGKRLQPQSNEKPATEPKRERRDDYEKRSKPSVKKEKFKQETIQTHGILSDGITAPKPSVKFAPGSFKSDRKRVICEDDDDEYNGKAGSSKRTEIGGSMPDLSDEQVLEKLIPDSIIAEHHKDKRKTNSPVNLLTKIEPKYEEIKLEEPSTDASSSSNSFANENELLLFQMPTCLSQMVHKADATEEEKAAWASGNSMAGLPEGKIGQIHMMKSGRILLQIGDHEFAIKSGASVSFQQNLISIDDGHFYELGPVKQRLLVVPNLDPPASLNTSAMEI